MTLPLEEGHARDLAENAGLSARVLEMHAEEIRRLQDEYSRFDPQHWRSGAGRQFLERLQDIIRDLSACGEALAAAAAARRELARTPQDKAWG
ncbi:hypothetical protein H9639_05420 [Arthrobacter sp. Sa2CUA1]|uniref:WXG100 family type VII secretion target n=1 Tax=Arthrobacter gallicola TaxID=2762225 RepID=A0ABR8UQC3_9MICC|nr:hypothetical protein [Arthrobacter gallicola]MBD7994734.1 hypothetical protein [Arthrobacter gallicola]